MQNFDDEFHSLLEKLVKENGENSVIIFMSDHGYRFGSFRETFLGYYEEALPFFFFRLPPSLKASHPLWYANLRTNSHRLTSPFDLYSTLRDILSIAKASSNETVEDSSNTNSSSTINETSSDLNKVAPSFFDIGPKNRTCETSGIPQKYCICGVTPHLFQNKELIAKSSNLIVSQINKYLEPMKNSCVVLEYKKSVYAREVGNGEKWNNLGKIEGYTDHILALETKPGDGRFEGRVRSWNNGLQDVLGEISRINSYKGQSDCVEDYLLKNYCMCKDVVEKQNKIKADAKKKKSKRKKRTRWF
jgi:hypothetical protein